MPRRRRLLTLVLTLPLALAHAASADTFFVDSLDDDGPGTLRQAIISANATAGADTILFGAGLGGTIALESGLPGIVETLDLIGPAAEVVTVDAQQNDRLFTFSGPADSAYTVQGLTLTGGLPLDLGGGGGIALLSGRLTLEGVRVLGNTAGGSAQGGGIFAAQDAQLIVRRSSVADNVATASGGGIYGQNVTVDQSAVYGNTSRLRGGGVWANGTLLIFESTISGNRAQVESPTISQGGGVYLFFGTLTMFESTIRDNESDTGPGLYIDPTASIVELSGSIVAGNRFEATGTEGNCNRDLGQVNRRNLSGDASCGFSGADDLQNTDPRLAPLAFAGGPTPSYVPFPGSPVIDASLDEFCVEVDQRGFARPVDGDGDGGAICDIGAVEYTPGLEAVLFGDGFEAGDLSAWSIVAD